MKACLRVPGLVLLCLAMAFPAFSAARKAETKVRKGAIQAPSGLFLRRTTARSGKTITRIPGGETVEIVSSDGPYETIENRKSRWFKIPWKNYTRWVFGGFVAGASGKIPTALADPEPHDSATSSTPESQAGLGPKDPALLEEEAAFLKNCATRASREGATLRLRAKAGKVVSLEDNQSAEENAQLFYFRGYIPEIGYFLVYRTSWEFTNYSLIDENSGTRVDIDENPVFSPGFQRFVTASLDLVAGLVPNGMKVYRVEKGKIALEWLLSPGDWGPSDAKWQSETSLAFTKNWPGGKTLPGRAGFNPKTKKWNLK